MKVKAFIFSGLSILALNLPSIASATNLTVRNYTKFDSTCKINGVCSNILREAGITKAGDLNHQIPESMVKLICHNSSDCKADVYMTNNCTGNLAATVYFDVNAGTKRVVSVPNSPFKITSDYHSFVFTLAGGPR